MHRSILGGITLLLLFTATAAALTPEEKCRQKKLKAHGKLELCLKTTAAKMIAGKPDASAKCQTKLHDALTKAGTACRFVDNGDGTVSDLDLGLMWEKKDDAGGALHDKDEANTWAVAMSEFITSMNGLSADGSTQTGLAGYSDWRLPTSAELQSLLLEPFPCSTNPCVDSAVGLIGNYYWSSTSHPNSAGWAVSLQSGHVTYGLKSSPGYRRAVRSGL
jgi:hypothetical protein